MTEQKSKVPDNVKESIGKVLELLKSGNLPEVVAKSVFPRVDKPLSSWSLSNRLICYSNWAFSHIPALKDAKTIEEREKIFMQQLDEIMDKADYRGFKQWKEIGRYVKKGESASYILAPSFKKAQRYYIDVEGKKIYLQWDSEVKKHYYLKEGKKEFPDSIKIEEYNFLYGFFVIPVFSVEQTEGKPIVYKELKLPEMPYLEVADFLNIKVTTTGFTGEWYGLFNPSRMTIKLATPDQSTFFHELAHAVDDYIMKKTTGVGLKGGQQSDQEIVAHLSAATLSLIVGYKIEESVAYTKKYIEYYTESQDPEKEVIKLLNRIEKVVEFIANFKEAKSPVRQAEEKHGEPKDKTEELADNPKKPTEK